MRDKRGAKDWKQGKRAPRAQPMDARSSEISESTHPPLEHEPGELSAPANPRTMFFLLLPAGAWVANVMGSYMAHSAGPDTNDISSACFIVALLPVAPICLIAAVRQAIRKMKGWSAFGKGLMWNILLVVAVWAIMSVALQNAKGKKARWTGFPAKPSVIHHGTP